MLILLLLGIPFAIATVITIYSWKKDAGTSFLGKTFPEFIRIWVWSLIFGLLIVGTIANFVLN